MKDNTTEKKRTFKEKTLYCIQRYWKRILLIIAMVIIAAIVVPLICYKVVEKQTEKRLYSNVNEIPYNRVGLLLGTNPKARSGRDNFYFVYRIEACAELYHAKKISKILISGDNSTKEYDEPESMKQALIAKGVPGEDIVLDYAGFRTLDSIIRAKKIFGQTKLTIISQRFHNERAIYLALENGIDAIGYNAKEIRGSTSFLKTGYLREGLARVKMFLDIWFGKSPKFLGKQENI